MPGWRSPSTTSRRWRSRWSVGGARLGGLFAPSGKRAEFFGLSTFFTRLVSIAGLFSCGLIAWATSDNLRVAMACTTALFVLGRLALMPLDVRRGRQAALHAARYSYSFDSC